ncbi:hypothetical protein FACS1894130_02190 [Spirochaetia bacterium]|nr:hypothetical protein FACS1894130_02190 [Spirochaetia bacterium]
MSALVLRSAALFAILYQFRLLAQDLADTPVFAAALVCAFAAAWALAVKKARLIPALVTLLLIPWAARGFIALPRLFITGSSIADGAAEHTGASIVLDSLLLNLDRNNFVSLIPFYWAALTTWFAARSRRFLRGDIVASLVILLVLFCVVRTADLEAYRWPVLMIALFAGVIFLQIIALMLSLPPEYLTRTAERIRAAVILFLLVLIGGILMIRPSQEGAIDKGGGLLQPNLFQFDFSQFLRLESEITMNEDLVLIVRKDPEDYHFLLRRFVLSGYGAKQGFYRHEKIDEAAHPQKLPDRRLQLEAPSIQKYRSTEQEYFLVNFDSSALIGMNQPVEIIPYDRWDASSFSSAYGVTSYTSEARPFELFNAAPRQAEDVSAPLEFSAEDLGLDTETYAYYTEYGRDERIAAFAQEITRGRSSYWDMVRAVYERLKFGEYRYSLKPGIAPDGDQLGYFLFESKKGYCSYYAFAMTVLLRSLGIPVRVAVGFYIDPRLNTFDYYPVRSDMAHAWVEVYYPEYGWIEYDPTTEQLAVDEDFRLPTGIPPDIFERLMKEILENRSRLTPKEGSADGTEPSSLAALGKRAGQFIRQSGAPLLLGLVCIIFILMRCGHFLSYTLTANPRKKTIHLWAHVLRRLRFGGFKRPSQTGESEWALALDESRSLGVYALYQDAAAARFAPEYHKEEVQSVQNHYRAFSGQYKKTVPLRRRILAWLFPPLALVLGLRKSANSAKPGDGGPAGNSNTTAGTLMIFIVALLFFLNTGIAGAQDTDEAPDSYFDSDQWLDEGALLGEDWDDVFPDAENDTDDDAWAAMETADDLFMGAVDAQRKERWERAIELYSRGSEQYPQDSRFPWALGSLYYSRDLYGLAWDEYRKVEKLLPSDPDVLYRLSQTAGYLNREAVSAEYLERTLILEPDNQEAISSLGWMYSKLHRLSDGERLLLAAIHEFGPAPNFCMTMGTIYSDMFRYEDAKTWYLDAIAGGEKLGDWEFAAVAHYNLSILESRFYHYAESFDRTTASLDARNRAPGRLARGELFLRRLDLSRAFTEYQTAYEIDTSPLSKINLAQAYQIAGRLDEARLYAEASLKSRDLSWMLNYGIDLDRYKRDIHEILHKTYSGLTKTEKRKIYGTLGESIRGLFRGWAYTFKAATHQRLYRKYSLLAAKAYDADPGNMNTVDSSAAGTTQSVSYGEQGLDAQIQYYNAFEAYPRRAIGYLRSARKFEVPLIPQSESSYDMEEGRLLENRELLINAIPAFDPLWERDVIADTYAELCLQLRGKRHTAERWDAAERLYALNHGALRQNGITLPVELALDTENAPRPRRTERILRRTLRKMGIEVIPAKYRTGNTNDDADPSMGRFRLNITVNGGDVRCELYDGGRGTGVFRRAIPLPSPSAKDISAFAETLGEVMFTGNTL